MKALHVEKTVTPDMTLRTMADIQILTRESFQRIAGLNTTTDRDVNTLHSISRELRHLSVKNRDYAEQLRSQSQERRKDSSTRLSMDLPSRR